MTCYNSCVVGVEEEHFRIILKYLLSFIQKDRQSESLVEKLCHRFRATRVERQWRDLAYCLSMLSYNEKCVRKLQENFACFGDKLADEDVYSCFMTIMSGAKKFSKPEAKVSYGIILYNWCFLQDFNLCYFHAPHDSVKITSFK